MPTGTQIKVEWVSDVAIISPQGDLEPLQESIFARLFGSLIQAKACKVVLNLSEVEHIHYKLLEQLNEVVFMFRGINGDLRFAAASPYLKKIFQVVTLDMGRQLFDSLNEALLSFAERPAARQALH